jgi:hypothetical protein
MPWCDECSKFWNPSSVAADGTCPTCGCALPAAAAVDPRKVNVRELAGEQGRAPWHFKLLVAAIVLYLGWRAVEGVGWLIERFG